MIFFIVVVYSFGSLIGGRFVNRIGRKKTVVYTWAARSVMIASIPFMPGLFSAFVMSVLATFVGGFALSAGPSLFLEQVPKYRGTMMSLNAVSTSLGAALGIFIGGFFLANFNFQVLGVGLSAIGLISSVIILFFAKEFES